MFLTQEIELESTCIYKHVSKLNYQQMSTANLLWISNSNDYFLNKLVKPLISIEHVYAILVYENSNYLIFNNLGKKILFNIAPSIIVLNSYDRFYSSTC